MVILGIKGRQETTVTTANIATNVGSGKVKVFDERGLIGEGTHERFIIDVEKFQSKAENKSTPKDEAVRSEFESLNNVGPRHRLYPDTAEFFLSNLLIAARAQIQPHKGHNKELNQFRTSIVSVVESTRI